MYKEIQQEYDKGAISKNLKLATIYIENNIPTIRSQLRYMRLKLYIEWGKPALSLYKQYDILTMRLME